MSLTVYIVSAVSVFFFSGLMAMAGLGAAFIFVPLFYYLGVPLAEAVPTALLLNVVSLMFAAMNYYRGGLINWRIGLPILITAVLLAPLGAHTTPFVDRRLFLAMFSGFLDFAGFMMIFYRAKPRSQSLNRAVEAGAGAAVGVVAGFLGGLLGVGGGNFIVPGLNGLGIDAKVAAGTTAMVVVFASLSGFLGHVSLGGLSPLFLGLMALMSALGSIAGSHLMRSKLTSAQLKKIIGVLLWLIAAKMIFDLVK
jgi:uncharacterized membrane protein YfcA